MTYWQNTGKIRFSVCLIGSSLRSQECGEERRGNEKKRASEFQVVLPGTSSAVLVCSVLSLIRIFIIRSASDPPPFLPKYHHHNGRQQDSNTQKSMAKKCKENN